MIETNPNYSQPVNNIVGFIHVAGGGTRLKNKGYQDLDMWPKELLSIPYNNSEFGLKRATMIDRTLLELRKEGFSNFLCFTSSDNGSSLTRTHIEAFYGENKLIPVKMSHYTGQSVEGAAGSSYLAINKLDLNSLCYMTPGDTLFPFNKLHGAIASHYKTKADITWTVTDTADESAQNKGRIIIEPSGKVIGAFERENIAHKAQAYDESMRFTSTGVIVVDTNVYKKIFEEYVSDSRPSGPLDLWRDVINWAISKKYHIYGYNIAEPAQDLGEVDRLRSVGGLI